MDVRAVKHSASHWVKIQVLAQPGSLLDAGLELFACPFQHPEAAAFLSSWRLPHLQSQQQQVKSLSHFKSFLLLRLSPLANLLRKSLQL